MSVANERRLMVEHMSQLYAMYSGSFKVVPLESHLFISLLKVSLEYDVTDKGLIPRIYKQFIQLIQTAHSAQ